MNCLISCSTRHRIKNVWVISQKKKKKKRSNQIRVTHLWVPHLISECFFFFHSKRCQCECIKSNEYLKSQKQIKPAAINLPGQLPWWQIDSRARFSGSSCPGLFWDSKTWIRSTKGKVRCILTCLINSSGLSAQKSCLAAICIRLKKQNTKKRNTEGFINLPNLTIMRINNK